MKRCDSAATAALNLETQNPQPKASLFLTVLELGPSFEILKNPARLIEWADSFKGSGLKGFTGQRLGAKGFQFHGSTDLQREAWRKEV